MLRGKLILICDIELLSPTIIGSGESKLSDLDVIKDSDGKPYIPSTSFVGVLRHTLGRTELEKEKLDYIFGSTDPVGHEKIRQSSIFVSDLIPKERLYTSIRDGVKIDRKKGIAEDKAKFDYEIIEIKSCFTLKMEANLGGEYDIEKERILVTVCKMLKNGELRVGAKTSSGFGKLGLKDSRFYKFDFKNKKDVLDWFKYLKDEDNVPPEQAEISIDSYNVKPYNLKRKIFRMKAHFSIRNSLIIRSYNIEKNSPDIVHISSCKEPIIPGTSLKGAIRSRAEKIINTLGIQSEIIDDLFGIAGPGIKKAKKGRLIIEETLLSGFPSEVQTRIKIDRFTGGTIEGALVEAKPLFSSKDEKTFQVDIKVEDCKDYEVGLLLLILKDLWTGDLPIGGEKSIGRGFLEGKKAEIFLENEKIEFDNPSKLSDEQKRKLQGYVNDLLNLGGC